MLDLEQTMACRFVNFEIDEGKNTLEGVFTVGKFQPYMFNQLLNLEFKPLFGACMTTFDAWKERALAKIQAHN
jgi:hypothetical protein